MSSRHAESSSTSCLPPEILAHIFRHLAREDWGKPLDTFPCSDSFLQSLPPDGYRWIRITHVCQRWRAVALDTPDLWSRINTRNQDLFSQCLVRSRQYTALDVGILVQGPDASHVGSIAPELHRIRRLKLFGYSPASLQAAWDTLAGSVVNLTDLNITRHYADRYYDEFTIPNGAFEGSPLRRLVLCNVSFRLNNPIFVSSITDLALFFPTYSPRVQFSGMGTCKELLTVLKRMPNLESLVLASAINLPAADLPTCTFPCLRRLCLLSTAKECAVFLSHVSFPSTATVALRVTGKWVSGDVPAFAQAILPCFTPSVRSVTLEVDPARLRFRGALANTPPETWNIKADHDPTTSFPPPYDEDIPIDIVIQKFNGALPVLGAVGQHLPGVRHLCIRTGHDFDYDPIRSTTWAILVESLSVADPQQPAPFPTLDVLDLRDLEIFRRNAGHAWDEVLKWLEQRFHHDIPVREVRASRCTPSKIGWESIVDQIGGYVETIVWDGDLRDRFELRDI